VPEGSLHTIYFDSQEWDKLLGVFTNRMLKEDMVDYRTRFEKQGQYFLEWGEEKNLHTNWNTLSDQQLSDFIREFDLLLIDFADWQFFAFCAIFGPIAEVEKKFGKQKNGNEILQWISTPFQHTRMTNARIDLLKMVRDGMVDDAHIAEYLEEYRWLPMYQFCDPELTEAEVRKQIAQVVDVQAELLTIERTQKRGYEHFVQFLKTVDDERLHKLIDVAHAFAYLKEMRDDYRRPFYFAFRPFWDEIEARTGLSLTEANHLLPQELAEAILSPKENWMKKIRDRMDTFSLVLEDGILRIEAVDISSRYLQDTRLDEIFKVRGVSACGGLVRGPVRIIYHKDEFDKFHDGDVLVSAMTHPEFLPIMKRACAFVTDEGGITCHASIVARELGKPCVIGTGNATKVFKDGDMVEVDGDNGHIKIV